MFRFVCWLRGFHLSPCYVWRTSPVEGKPLPDLDIYASKCVTCGDEPGQIKAHGMYAAWGLL